MAAAVQSMYNRGYDVSEAEKYLEEGLTAARDKDGAILQVLTAEYLRLLIKQKKREGNKYDSFTEYLDFSQIKSAMNFTEAYPYDVYSTDFSEK